MSIEKLHFMELFNGFVGHTIVYLNIKYSVDILIETVGPVKCRTIQSWQMLIFH